jgi:hypothetical protein
MLGRLRASEQAETLRCKFFNPINPDSDKPELFNTIKLLNILNIHTVTASLQILQSASA